jgi:hypothetical protein
VEILTTHEIKKLNYQIFNYHGAVIDSQIFAVQDSSSRSKKLNITISPQPSMAPKSKIIFFYITSDGEIISDKIKIKLEKHLQNSVS